jgi:DNA replication protein DnaC
MSDDIVDALRRIGIRSSRETILALIAHATKSRLAATEVVEQLVALELRERDARNLVRRTRAATLGPVPPLDTFDWNHPRTIDRDLYELLLGLEFVGTGANVLFRGQSGVGKTMLAQNLGLRAIQQGKTVLFSTLAAVLADLLKQESIPAVERRLKRYTLPDLLILDELGYLLCDNRSADLLYNIVSRRHERKSTVISTNLAFKQWSSVFPNAACVGALVDRFAQHCHTMDIDADSWRQKAANATSPGNSKGSPKKLKS